MPTEITTISLEPAGDIRPVDTLAPDRLVHELAVHRSHLERLFEKAHSRTDNLEKESKTELPGEILFDLAALVVHGDEPVSLRYFRLTPDGSIAYVTQADIDAAKKPGERRALFANAELRFRRAGDTAAPVQVLRHMSFNLDDAHLKADPSLRRLPQCARKGRGDDEGRDAPALERALHDSSAGGSSTTRTGWCPTRPAFPRGSPARPASPRTRSAPSTARRRSAIPTGPMPTT